MKIILIILAVLFAYVFVFALANAQSNLHRMEERWEINGEPPFNKKESDSIG